MTLIAPYEAETTTTRHHLGDPIALTPAGSVEATQYAAAVMRAREPWLVPCEGCGDDVHRASLSGGQCGACRWDSEKGYKTTPTWL